MKFIIKKTRTLMIIMSLVFVFVFIVRAQASMLDQAPTLAGFTEYENTPEFQISTFRITDNVELTSAQFANLLAVSVILIGGLCAVIATLRLQRAAVAAKRKQVQFEKNQK